MRNIWIIARREYAAYFNSPIAYVISAMILVVVGIIMAAQISFAVQSPGFAPGADGIVGTVIFMLVFTVPAITMRLLADETRLGTIEILLTSPVRDIEVVVGKWLGAMLFMLTTFAFTLVYPLLLNSLIDPGLDFGLVWSGYLALVLATSVLVAIGLAVSSIFSNLVATFVSTMGLFVVVWFLMAIPGQLGTGPVSEFFRNIDMQTKFNLMSRGVIELADVIFFITVTALFLMISSVSLETRRWR